MAVLLSKKGKCTGCKALERTKDTNGNHIFVCSLIFTINFVQAGTKALSPRPADKCYQPTTSADLKEAAKIVQKKIGAAPSVRTDRDRLLEQKAGIAIAASVIDPVQR